ncbi:LysR family transcriptional regulator [Bradyrhizobium sp. HKCCYLS20291]|uniref:LysR family transcriptional regulator n=1 Tax=Bradyrhizobium sp. HKCCYLS20291 TaxID=3420766 RepID=UPI003EC06E00
MRNFNLDQLQTLIAIADLGTLAAAAQALHLAPPTVSLHLRELESRIGTRLLDRGHRRASLTPAGVALVEGGRQLLANAEDLGQRVRRRAEGKEGIVRVATSAGVNSQLLPAVLSLLGQRNAGVEIKLQVMSSAEAMIRLQAGGIDIGIVAVPQPFCAGVRITTWRNDPMAAFVPNDWEAPARVTPQWLATRPWITLEPKTQMYLLVAAWFGKAGLVPKPRMQINYPEAILSLVSAGQAAAILPLPHAHDHDRSNFQVRRLRPNLIRSLGLAHRASKSADPAVLTVLRTLQEFSML